MDKRNEVDDLLRKCTVIASKLQLADFLLWAKRELNGYGSGDELPDYRVVGCEMKAWSPYNCQWVPLVCTGEPHEALRKRPVSQRIVEIQDLVSRQDGLLGMPMPESVAYKLMVSADAPTPPMFIISRTSLLGILDAVRTLVLDWSLKLEADGILGEGMTFTKEEKQTAQNNTYIMGDNYSAGQAGAMGPLAHAHDMTFNQISAKHLGHIDMRTLAVELSSLRREMRQAASEPEQDIAVGQVAAAERAAQKGDTSGVLRHLKGAGKWAFDVATKIGVSVASEAIKKSAGL
jgi:hypothetical protein